MASVRRVAKSPYWIARFRLPDGRPTDRSTRLKDKAQALRMAIALERPFRDRSQIARARALMREVLAIAGSEAQFPTTKEWLTTWLRRREPEVSASTLKRYQGAIATFLQGPAAGKPLDAVTRSDILEWRAAEAARTSPMNASSNAKALGVAFADAVRDGLLLSSPADRLPRLKLDEDRQGRDPFTEDQVKQIFGAVRGSEWEGVCLFGYWLGQRLRDIVLLDWSAVDLASKSVNMRARKTSRTTVLPLPDPLHDWLASRQTKQGPVFPELAKRARKSPAQVSKRFRALLVRLKLSGKTGGTGTGVRGPRRVFALSFHSFRHTATSRMKAAGVPEAVTMELVGHESKAIHRHYTHISLEQMREALSRR